MKSIPSVLASLLIAGSTLGAPAPAVRRGALSDLSPAQVRALTGFERWLRSHTDLETGLPVSHVGDLRLQDWCMTYDAAVAAIAYTAIGDLRAAARIVDFYIDSPEPRRLGGLIEAVRAGAPSNPQNGSVRTGANLWMGLASMRLYAATRDPRYRAFAERIGDFALALQDAGAGSPTRGGLRLGPAGDDSYDGDQHIWYDPSEPALDEIFATEVTVDAYALFSILTEATGDARFRHGRELCLVFLKGVAWNSAERRFNRGYYRTVDPIVATDAHAWAVSALGADGLAAFSADAARDAVRFVESNCRATISYLRDDGATVTVSGFDFIGKKSLPDLKRGPMVSPEWTFQMANTYGRLARDAAGRGDLVLAHRYADKRTRTIDGVLPMAEDTDDGLALPYASLPSAPIGHEYDTPEAGNKSLIGVAYGILALTRTDPLVSPFHGADRTPVAGDPFAVPVRAVGGAR